MSPELRYAVFGAMVIVSLGGCVAGPTALRASRMRYNEAIQDTRREELLLNLVRLRYREEPLFLDVGSIAAQFVFRESMGAGANLPEGPAPSRKSFSIDGDLALEERPTITLSPLQGEDFASRLLTPLRLEPIVILSRSGWAVDRVMRLTIQGMNGLDNASRASGPTPTTAPDYQSFQRATELFRELQIAGLLSIGFEPRSTPLSDAMPASSVTLADAVAATQQGYKVVAGPEARTFQIVGDKPALVWRVPSETHARPETQELIALLGLKPGLDQYELRLGVGGEARFKGPRDGRSEIIISTRSVMGVLFYLSQAVEVPTRHEQRGYVTVTTDADGRPFDWGTVTGDLLRIGVSSMPPSDATIAVQHWGYWYSIGNADLTSKSTLALLGQLFALQAGASDAPPPVLTLGVGG